MKPIRTFSVIPSLPPQLQRLGDIARNLRWSWNHDAVALFRRLDEDLWLETGHNPVLMLGRVDQTRLEEIAADEAFLVQLERVAADLDRYMARGDTWFSSLHGQTESPTIAYFSMEFGLTDCVNIFAGGLGLLAGDHLKSSSDLGVPLVGVGLLYQQGYFRQTLNDAGWQQEFAEENDFHNLPLALERAEDGSPLIVESPHPGRTVKAQVWKAQVGRISLYLLDTNIDLNRPEDRDITDQLYGGDIEMRIRQEIVLGIGGCRALRALGLSPIVYHMNEGHSAFLSLERVSQLMRDQRLSFAEAREAASAGLIFTTHTPVIAGHDSFPPYLVERYLTDYIRSLGISRNELMGLGRRNPSDEGEPFWMTVLALRMAAYTNGVSKLHGEISREMWQALWPSLPVEEVPIGHVTNGVHLRSWVSDEMETHYDRYIGSRWRNEPPETDSWEQASRIPAEELWRTHERRRERLIAFARRKLREQLEHRGVPLAEIERAGSVLDPEVLTIGFARRFATYKRATLLLRDPERLMRLITDPERPVQFIFAGKAHPRDDAGKELIRQIIAFSRQPAVRNRFVFLEDYDMETARFLVQGCDIWLNNPRRPEEASGTSGMKAAANGVLNFSTLDGWWAEAWDDCADQPVPVGWAIGRGETYDNWDYQDQVEAEDIYDVLERDIIPCYYERGTERIPRDWISRMQATIEHLGPFVSSHRMLRDYVTDFYIPAIERSKTLADADLAGARSLAEWRTRVEKHWSDVRVETVENNVPNEVRVGEPMVARAKVHLGALKPADVAVQMYTGRLNAVGDIVDAEMTPMHLAGEAGSGAYVFESAPTPWRVSGLHGYTVRVLPAHPALHCNYLPGLLTWATV